MRYYWKDRSLFIQGNFRLAGTIPGSGIRDVSSIIFGYGETTVISDTQKEIEIIAGKNGIFHDYVGSLSLFSSSIICQIDSVTVFTINGNSKLSFIILIKEPLDDATLLSVLLKTGYCAGKALSECDESNLTTGDCIIAIEAQGNRGKFSLDLVCAAINKGVLESRSPAVNGLFFIFSRLSGGEWIKWERGHCKFYPCHFKGQRCDYCYCPFYPCKDESLGQWVFGQAKNQVWNCSNCTLLHETQVANYLEKNPCAGLSELKKVREQNFTL